MACRYFRFGAGLVAAWLLGAMALAGEIDNLKQGVVRVLSHGKDGIQRTGTGFIVKVAQDRTHIVTATHVVQGAERVEVEFFAKRDTLVPANVGKMEDDQYRGIAYLIVSSGVPAGVQALSLAPQSKLSEGTDEVLTLGFPQGAPGWSPKSLKFATRDGRELLFDGKVNTGNSGGPVLKDGQVVGLIQSERSGYVRANPASAVVEFLEGSGVSLAAGSASASAPPPEVGRLVASPADRQTARDVAAVALKAYKARDLRGLLPVVEGDNEQIVAELIARGSNHPRYKLIFEGRLWEVVSTWDGQLGDTRYSSRVDNSTGTNQPVAHVKFGELGPDEFAVVLLEWHREQWWFEDVKSPTRTSFEALSTHPTDATLKPDN